MNYTACAALIAQIEDAKSFPSLTDAIAHSANALGFDFFALAQRDSSNMLMADKVVSNYPEAYLTKFSPERILRHDPNLARAQTSLNPFWWSANTDPNLTAAEREYVAECDQLGIGQGFIVPLHPIAQPTGLFAFSLSSARPKPIENEAYASYLANRAFNRALILNAELNGANDLTEFQRNVLRQLARGRSAAIAAQMLGQQPDVIHRAIRKLKEHYRAATPTELVVHALHDRAISYSDVL